MNRRILILGSGGQIGAYLTDYLNKIGYEVLEFDIVNGLHHDMTEIPNAELHRQIMRSHFVFFLAFDVGGSHYLKKYQHTFKFIELYTKSLGGLIVKFWNVYGIEKDMEKAHVITDFIRKGFETGVIDMMTDGTESREFLYAEDCCEGLEAVMGNYDRLTSDDELHITTGNSTTILEIAQSIQKLFSNIGKEVVIKAAESKDEVQKDAKNVSDPYIQKFWRSTTSVKEGLTKVFYEMKKNYE